MPKRLSSYGEIIGGAMKGGYGATSASAPAALPTGVKEALALIADSRDPKKRMPLAGGDPAMAAYYILRQFLENKALPSQICAAMQGQGIQHPDAWMATQAREEAAAQVIDRKKEDIRTLIRDLRERQEAMRKVNETLVAAARSAREARAPIPAEISERSAAQGRAAQEIKGKIVELYQAVRDLDDGDSLKGPTVRFLAEGGMQKPEEWMRTIKKQIAEGVLPQPSAAPGPSQKSDPTYDGGEPDRGGPSL